MLNTDSLQLRAVMPVRALNAGLFISKGEWVHSKRTLESFELIFVRQGVLSLQEENRTYRVEPGQTLLLWPGREHGGVQPNTEDLQFYWVHFVLGQTGAPNLGTLINIPQVCTIARPDRLTGLFRRFLDDQESKCLDGVSADMLVALMLNHVSLSPTIDDYLSGTVTLVAQRAESYIRTHFDKPLSTSSIAKALDYNADYLGRAFKGVFGITLTTFLQRQRLSQARTLLMDGTKSITQIAKECGFDDPGYFRRLFHRNEGMSPMAYRKLYARVHINTV